MGVFKEIKDRQLYLYIDGNLVYKRWLDTGQSIVFHDTTYNKYILARDLTYDYRDKLIIVKAKLKMKSTRTVEEYMALQVATDLIMSLNIRMVFYLEPTLVTSYLKASLRLSREKKRK